MRILISNDDGYNSTGIKVLAAALAQIASIEIVAPDHNNSAASNSLSIYTPLRAYKMAEHITAISGTPADSVHLGLTGLFAEPFDMVVAGINDGANLGEDVFYSGTVGAAMEGRMLRYPPIAVSMAVHASTHYATAAALTVQLIERVVKAVDAGAKLDNILLNLNVPDLELDAINGIKICRCGKRLAPEPAIKALDPRSRPIYWVGAAGQIDDASAGTDFAAIAAGYAALTPLVVDMTATNMLTQLENDLF